MEAKDKKFLDYAGLAEFWALVKDYYKDTVSKADSALQNIIAEGVVTIADGVATFDFSNFAKKSEVASVFTFKGVNDTYAVKIINRKLTKPQKTTLWDWNKSDLRQ